MKKDREREKCVEVAFWLFLGWCRCHFHPLTKMFGRGKRHYDDQGTMTCLPGGSWSWLEVARTNWSNMTYEWSNMHWATVSGNILSASEKRNVKSSRSVNIHRQFTHHVQVHGSVLAPQHHALPNAREGPNGQHPMGWLVIPRWSTMEVPMAMPMVHPMSVHPMLVLPTHVNPMQSMIRRRQLAQLRLALRQ